MQGLTHTDSTSTKKFGAVPGNEVAYTRVKNAYQVRAYQAKKHGCESHASRMHTLTNRYLRCIKFGNEITCNKNLKVHLDLESTKHNNCDMDRTHIGCNCKHDIYNIYKLWNENQNP